MRILMIGDVVGEAGCDFLQKKLPLLKKETGADIAVVNGENSARGNGITAASARQILRSGADIITTGNHAFQQRRDLDIYEQDCILRPANYSAACPGKGVGILDMGCCTIAVVNLSGVLFLENLDNPFTVMDGILEKLSTPNIFVDFHAEATSEKKAMGYYLAGRVTAVAGTHTHVPTADACILKGGTGYITDLGMTGAEDSVLGVEKQCAIDRLRLHVPGRYTEASGDCFLCGIVVEFEHKSGKCTKIEQCIVR